MKKTFTVFIIFFISFIVFYFIVLNYEERTINFAPLLKHRVNQRLNDIEFDNTDYINNSVEIKEKVQLDNKIITYYTFKTKNKKNNNIYKQDGWWVFQTKGGSSKGGISSPSSTYFLTSEIIETNKAKYIVIFGENKNNYEYIKFKVDSTQYEKKLPDKKYFIIYEVVPESTELFQGASDIKFR